jgi:hypothetical protein
MDLTPDPSPAGEGCLSGNIFSARKSILIEVSDNTKPGCLWHSGFVVIFNLRNVTENRKCATGAPLFPWREADRSEGLARSAEGEAYSTTFSFLTSAKTTSPKQPITLSDTRRLESSEI